jgi:hypothetical protein
MLCNNCSKTNLQSAAFCSNCGDRLVATAPLTPPVVQAARPAPAFPTAAPAATPTPTATNYSPGNYAVAQKTNGKAVASLVLSLLGFSILGVIFGHIARGEIRRSNNTQTGDGLALAGLIIGWIGTSLWLLFWLLIFVAAAFA